MKVHLTFDVEVWCGGWDDLDRRFPLAYERYIYGRSRRGDYALPVTLEILARHGLRGVFFIEPMFSARFGSEYLDRIVNMVESAGHEVQLHLHPEWTDEITPPPLPGVRHKRQHLYLYGLQEQVQLLQFGLGLLRRHARGEIRAFRAGSYAANADTYRALAATGLQIDSSLNSASEDSGRGMALRDDLRDCLQIEGVCVFPITVFRDGRGLDRPAQVGACGLAEMRHALAGAAAAGRRHFVVVSHNFELLKPGRSEPDAIVVRRFEGLCRHLAANRDRYETCGFSLDVPEANPVHRLNVPVLATWVRLAEQVVRRIY